MARHGLLLLLGLLCVTAWAQESVYMTIAYCPDYFSGRGAVVKVDPTSGNWTITGEFSWPSDIFGCPLEYDPTVTFDRSAGELYLDFTDEFGLLIIIDVHKGKVVRTVHPKDPFFVGFVNMAFDPAVGLIGLAPHVEETGYCSDGCFSIGILSPTTGAYKQLSDIPFKAMLDDSHYYDPNQHVMFAQASYDLRTSGRCAPNDEDECIIALDTQTGALLNATWTPDWTIYKYAQGYNSNGTILSWVYGFDSTCRDPYNDFAFAQINLDAAKGDLQACISHNTTVDEDEWISTFSADDSLFATGSGDADSGEPQLLVFQTANGKTLLNSRLVGLGQALHATLNLYSIWSVDFYSPS